MEEKMNNLLSTFKRFMSDSKQQQKSTKQISFKDILSERNSIQHLIEQNPTNINEKVKTAIKNSSIFHYIYHSQYLQRTAEKIIEEDSQIMKQIQNDIEILQFAIDQKQTKQMNKNYQQIDGVLCKISPSIFGGQSQRYCSLNNNKFIYREDKRTQSQIAGIINFDVISFSISQIQKDKQIQAFQIKVDKGQKSFIFKGKNTDKTQEWYEKINKCISESQGKLHGYNTLVSYPRFWRKDYISECQFKKVAKTGDILLFRGMKSSAVLQRKMTGQEYDHIGVVLHNSIGQILIFQANGGFGVGICPWKKFIKHKWYQDQQIVAWRQLKIQRSQQFLDEISLFVQQNMGKKYKFSLKNYLISRSSTVDQEKKSFFCSSLVAKLYKKLGLLDSLISSDRYMPYDFADKENLKILKGKHGAASLQNEKIIVFNQK